MMYYVISESSNSPRFLAFTEKNKNIYPFECIESVIGKKLPSSITDRVFENGFFNHFTKVHGYGALQGSVGCFLSHLKAFEALVKSGDDYALICEDDALFEKGLDDAFILSMHEFDFVYINKRMKINSDSLVYGINELSVNNINGLGGEGYIISASAAQSIVSFFVEKGFFDLPCGFDGFLQSLCLKRDEQIMTVGKKSLNKWREILPFELRVGAHHPGLVIHDDKGLSLIRS